MQIPIAAFVVAEYMMSRRQSPAHGGGRFRSAHALIEPSGTENGVFGGWALCLACLAVKSPLFMYYST